MLRSRQHLLRLLSWHPQKFTFAGEQSAAPALFETFSTSSTAWKKGYSIKKIPLSNEEREGVKANLVEILRPFNKPVPVADIWEIAKEQPRFKSKRYMKQMLQHLKKIKVARTEKVNSRQFGYTLADRVRAATQSEV